MNKDKIINKVILITILICVMLAIVLSVIVHNKNKQIYFLKLPEFADIESVILEMKDKETKYIVKNDAITEIMNIIKGGFRTTKIESIQDMPINSKKVITIHINTYTKIETVYIYKKGFKYYLEQPYNGIYRITKDEYKNVYKYIK